ncbi:MAG: M23 family metallopeptidase, partial [Fibrobacterota bacterium]
MRKTPSRIFSAVLILSALSARAAEKYSWPVDCPPGVTSMFASNRPGRFHAGTDIKTWSRTGYKVFSVDDGYVYKLGMSPFGYGKVIYIKHDNGTYAVYAHLSGFTPRLKKAVRKRQYSQKRNQVKFALKKNAIRVKRGQHIGYSGETGIGAPHLHFELRDRHNVPFNPMIEKLAFDDKVPPHPSHIAFMPMDDETLIDHKNEYSLHVLKSSEGIFICSDTIEIEGKAGIAVKITDKSQHAPNIFSPMSYHMKINDSLVYGCVFNSFSYYENQKMGLDRNLRLAEYGYERFQNLYVAKGNDLNFYSPSKINSGLISSAEYPPGKTYNATIISKDHNGNACTVKAFFRTVRTPEIVSRNERFFKSGRAWKAVIKGETINTGKGIKDIPVRILTGASSWQAPLLLSTKIEKAFFEISFPAIRETPMFIKYSILDSSGSASNPYYFSIPAMSPPE